MHKLTGVHTHTHTKFNLHGHSSPDWKRPPSSFSPRLDPEVPHTVCPRLLSHSTNTRTHTQRKKKIQVNTDHKNKCIIYYT